MNSHSNNKLAETDAFVTAVLLLWPKRGLLSQTCRLFKIFCDFVVTGPRGALIYILSVTLLTRYSINTWRRETVRQMGFNAVKEKEKSVVNACSPASPTVRNATATESQFAELSSKMLLSGES